MGRKCEYYWCANSQSKNLGKSFFSFPKDPELCRQWVSRCESQELREIFSSQGAQGLARKKLCSDHFPPEAFRNPAKKDAGLRPRGIPYDTNSESQEEIICDNIEEPQIELVELICRLCLDTKDLLSFPSFYDSAVQEKITTIFNFPFESRASLPSSVCTHCLLQIDDFYAFTETVRRNQEQLEEREQVAIHIFTEVESMETTELTENVVKVEPTEPIELAQNFLKVELTEPIELTQKFMKTEPTEPNELAHNFLKVELTEPTESLEDHMVRIKSEYQDSDPDTINQVLTDQGEASVVRTEVNKCIVQSHQDETVQFKIEYEDDEMPNEPESLTEEGDKINKEDCLIRDFFSLNCETCSESFETFSLLKQHTTVVHDKKLIITCCNKKFSRRYNLLDHIGLHLNPNQFQCDTCDKTYKQKTDLINHQLSVHSGDEARPFECDQCQATFPKSYLLKAHQTKHVQMECDICQKVLSNLDTLRNDKIQVHSNGNKHVCGQEVSSKQSLERHKARLKPVTSETRVACPICSKWFDNAENVKNHIKKLHEGNETTYDVCQKVYPNRRAMDSHKLRTHSTTTYECDMCDKKFTLKLALKEHQSKHTGEKLYRCDLCGKSISKISFLYRHKKLKHPEEWLAEKQKAYATASKVLYQDEEMSVEYLDEGDD